ncbi:MAG: hypothetical protein U0835_07390 [Isosphaeraceae bacterium]
MTQARRALLCFFVLVTPALALADDAPARANRIRRPLGLCLNADGSRLFVANGRSGSLSVVDTALNRVLQEVEVGKGLSDVARLPDGRLLAVDQTGDAADFAQVRGGPAPRVGATGGESRPGPGAGRGAGGRGRPQLARLASVDVRDGRAGRGPAGSPDARPAFPAAGTSRGLEGAKRLVVADAFGGRLAVIEPESGRIDSVRNIPGHNIRGLAATPDGRSLVVAHQVLERTAPDDPGRRAFRCVDAKRVARPVGRSPAPAWG